MSVMVNDWRGRNPRDNIDAMIHSPDCPQALRYGHASHWCSYPSRERAEAEVGRLAFTCQNCLPRQGRVLRNGTRRPS